MRGWGLAAVPAIGVAIVACGLDMAGLGDVFTPTEGGLAESGASGGEGAEPDPEGGSSEGAPGADATMEAGGVDAAPPVDAPPPPPVDAGCPGTVCNGMCTSAPDCTQCPGASLLCKASGTCTGDCAACPGNPIACFACDATRRNPLGTCEPDLPGAYCLDTNYAGAYAGGQGYHCACGSEGDCPGDSQVCIPVGPGQPPLLGCFTCGEVGTDKASCKVGTGGGMCKQASASCK